MARLASLFLPQLAIERIARAERRDGRRNFPPHRADGEGDRVKPGGGAEDEASPATPPPRYTGSPSPAQAGEEKGVKPGHWRPGARWAREAVVRTRALRVAKGALVTWERT